MTPRIQKRLRQSPSPEPLHVTHRHAAGIDVHANVHWVAVPPADAPTPPADHPANLPAHVRSFGTCTADLIELANWLTHCGVKTIAMESTGIYWIALFELLESRGFEVLLVEPRQSRHAPGRPKSDVLDCQWLQRLHSYGLLTGSFRPADQVVVLRSYLRQRQMLIRYSGQHVQHMQKALEQMNVKLAEVVSDVSGVTGMAIIRAILRGERNPLELAKLRNDHCKRTEAHIARVLYDNWRAEHLFALQQAVTLYDCYRQQLQVCDEQLHACLKTFADQPSRQTCAGSVLPAYSGTCWCCKSHRGDGAKACRARVSAAEVRYGVCLSGDGSLRSSFSQAADQGLGPASRRTGISTRTGDTQRQLTQSRAVAERQQQAPTKSQSEASHSGEGDCVQRALQY
jgi:hypothetical protein